MSFTWILDTATYTYGSLTASGSASPALSGVSAFLYTNEGGVVALVVMLIVATAVTAITSSLVSRISSRADNE